MEFWAQEDTMPNSLPRTDEAILTALKTIAASETSPPWQGESTVMTSAMFGGFVGHANRYWFDTEPTFEYVERVTTVGMFMEQLRAKAKLIPV